MKVELIDFLKDMIVDLEKDTVSISSIKVERGSFRKDNWKTGFVDNFDSGDRVLTIYFTDRAVAKNSLIESETNPDYCI